MDKQPPPHPFKNARERTLDRAAKREAVLLAAVRMFNERGFHTTSLDDLAATLGISKPLIYHYLGAKDHVLFECLRLGLIRLNAAAEESASAPGTGLERLRMFMRRYGEAVMDDFGRCVIRTGEEVLTHENRDKFRALKREIDHELRRFMQAAVDDGSACIADIKLTSFTFAGALNWTARWQTPQGELTAPEIAAQLTDILINGITARAIAPANKENR